MLHVLWFGYERVLTELGAPCDSGRAGDFERMEDDLAKAQVARIAAEAALSTGLAAADDEADALRQQLLSALQKARDSELRATSLQQRNDQLAAERQVSAIQCCYLPSFSTRWSLEVMQPHYSRRCVIW